MDAEGAAHAQKTEKAKARSFGVQNVTSFAKSAASSASESQLNLLLDEYRSFNSFVKSFFKSIKADLAWRNRWETRRQAEGAMFQYINSFYNPRRRHSSLGGKSRLAFERNAA